MLDALAGYTRRTFVADLIAGVTVGLVALPLAMAFLERAEFVDHVGAENILPHFDAALARARTLAASGAVAVP